MPEEMFTDMNNDTENISTGGEDISSPVATCSAKNEASKVAKPIHIVFDVVDSVKGGSGKSTISLQLAAFWLSQPKFDEFNVKTSAYIIDLDLRGTSWRKNYDFLLGGEEALGKKYINRQLMYDFNPEDSIFWNLSTKIKKIGYPEDVVVPICICDPEATGEITPVKSDLLENAVYKIIDRIIARESRSQKQEEVIPLSGDSGDISKEIHIIFDMPPSYEAHAEHVFTHLLMDKDSELFRKLQDKSRYSFEINLLMIYAISRAHLEQNIVYIRNLLKSPRYSSYLYPMIKNNMFSIYFIGNDISNVLTIQGKDYQPLKASVIEAFSANREPMIPEIFATLKDNLENKISFIDHLHLAEKNLATFLSPKEYSISPELEDSTNKTFKVIYGLEKTLEDKHE